MPCYDRRFYGGMRGMGQGVYRAGMEPESATAEEKSMLDKALADFMAKIKAFYDNFTGLKLQRGFVEQHPELTTEYGELLARGNTIDANIKRAKELFTAAQQAIGGIVGWFKDVFGMSGMTGLGALPAIPIAIAAGATATALITKWLADVYVFSKKIETIKAAEAAGGRVSPAMQKILETGTGPGFLDMLQKNIIWIVIGGTLLMFGPEIIKMLRR